MKGSWRNGQPHGKVQIKIFNQKENEDHKKQSNNLVSFGSPEKLSFRGHQEPIFVGIFQKGKADDEAYIHYQNGD